MADFFGELLFFVIRIVFEGLFLPCHSQRGCALTLLTAGALVAAIGCFIVACVLAEGKLAAAMGGSALVSGALFVVLGIAMICCKCADEP
jgi:hypothetical protein